MKDARSPSEAEILDEALRRSSPEDRAAYLREVIRGDEQLRQRVEALLRAHESTGQVLDSPPAAVAAETLTVTTGVIPVTEKSGDKIGHYKLLQQMGEGGCGVVYVAEQQEPVRRRVALKIIKLGMDTKQVVGRFEAERQALALMDHPNIAKVLDAGATDTGRPYFVMELVRGIKITDYCDLNNLSTEERINLFIQVCQAIQHAHQKGIIHRDIKPSNILVTLNDGVPVPKVIDFGIAKATTDQRLTDKTIYTAFEQFIGTPAYMSPEQAEMSGLDIDTRSDIYALGVLLYELLTGRPPFDPTALRQAGVDQMRRIIREQEPPRPSTRLSALDHADLTAVANHRQAEPPRLVHLIRGDLDWIVMKCLEKDRTRRFETANALAMDVRRHLNNEPVVARPPSQLYRLQKLMRRNRFAFAASGMVAAIVILGLSVSLLLLHSEKQARRRALIAEQAETQMRQEAEVRRLSAQVQDLESEGKLPEAEASYRAMLAIQKSLLGEVNTNVIDSLDSLASLFNRQGKLPEAESTYREELAIRKKLLGNDNADVASSLDDLARVLDREGKHAEREGACREALAIRRRILGNQDPRVATSLYNLGWALWQRGELAEAETVQREALAIRRKTIGDEHSDVAWSLRAVAWVLRDQAKLSEAETAQRELLALGRKRPGANFPHEIESLANLSHILQEQNKLAEAETVRREVVAIRKKLRAGDVSAGVTSSLDDLAGLLERQGKLSEAAAWRREMVAIQQRVLGNENTIVASSLDGLAYVLERETKLIEAEACRREALQIKRKLLGSENPLVANSIHWLGDILARQGRFAEAEAMQREALATQRKLLGNEHEDTIWSLRTLAWALRDQGKLAEAESVQREALALIKKTRGKDHADVASVLGDLAYILEMQNKLAEAETAYREALAGTENQSQNAGLLRSRGNFRARTGRWTEAVADLSKALLLDANEPFPWLQLASLLIETGDLTGYQKHRQAMLARLAGTSDPRIAEMTAKAALLLPVSGADLTTASRLADMAINAGKDEQLLAYFQFAKGLAEYRQGRFANSVEWTEKALAAPEVAFRAVQASMVLAMAHHQLKQSDEARAALAKGVEIAATKLPKLESADLGSDWRDWIIGHALMREAKILIEGGAKAGDQTK